VGTRREAREREREMEKELVAGNQVSTSFIPSFIYVRLLHCDEDKETSKSKVRRSGMAHLPDMT